VLSDKDLHFAMTCEKNDEPDGGKTVQGLETETFTVAELASTFGPPGEVRTYFKVKNLDADVEGHFKVEIL